MRTCGGRKASLSHKPRPNTHHETGKHKLPHRIFAKFISINTFQAVGRNKLSRIKLTGHVEQIMVGEIHVLVGKPVEKNQLMGRKGRCDG
jgi:hypothetical protein